MENDKNEKRDGCVLISDGWERVTNIMETWRNM